MSWTSAVCTISCLFNWNVLIKLEPQLTQVGANKWFLPTVVTICLLRFEAGVNTFPHISHMKYILSIICIFWTESYTMHCNVPIYVPHYKSLTTQHPNFPSSFLPTADKTFASMEQLCLPSKCEFQGRSSGWLWERQGPSWSPSRSSKFVIQSLYP